MIKKYMTLMLALTFMAACSDDDKALPEAQEKTYPFGAYSLRLSDAQAYELSEQEATLYNQSQLDFTWGDYNCLLRMNDDGSLSIQYDTYTAPYVVSEANLFVKAISEHFGTIGNGAPYGSGTLYAGIKGGKLWLGLNEGTTRELSKEWVSDNAINRNPGGTYISYVEPVPFRTSTVNMALMAPDNYILAFLNGSKLNVVELATPSTGQFREWYQGSVLAGTVEYDYTYIMYGIVLTNTVLTAYDADGNALDSYLCANEASAAYSAEAFPCSYRELVEVAAGEEGYVVRKRDLTLPDGYCFPWSAALAGLSAQASVTTELLSFDGETMRLRCTPSSGAAVTFSVKVTDGTVTY